MRHTSLVQLYISHQWLTTPTNGPHKTTTTRPSCPQYVTLNTLSVRFHLVPQLLQHTVCAPYPSVYIGVPEVFNGDLVARHLSSLAQVTAPPTYLHPTYQFPPPHNAPPPLYAPPPVSQLNGYPPQPRPQDRQYWDTYRATAVPYLNAQPVR